MNNMFNSSSKPFYQSSISMGLEPIPIVEYTGFARRMFEMKGKEVDADVVENVYRRLDGCTWFVQMMMNELFAITPTGGRCVAGMVGTAWRNVVMAQENSYKDLLSRLSPKQKMILQAIAREGRASRITSADFIKKYNLPSASSVQSAVKPLLKNDLLTQEGDTYRVYDYFFREWLKLMY